MIQIKIKRVYDDPEPGDGYRVLVDRLWPRGIKKACLSYDEWAKEITPSPGLRTWFHDDISRHWEEFTSMYKEELEHSQAVKDFLSRIGTYPNPPHPPAPPPKQLTRNHTACRMGTLSFMRQAVQQRIRVLFTPQFDQIQNRLHRFLHCIQRAIFIFSMEIHTSCK